MQGHRKRLNTFELKKCLKINLLVYNEVLKIFKMLNRHKKTHLCAIFFYDSRMSLIGLKIDYIQETS